MWKEEWVQGVAKEPLCNPLPPCELGQPGGGQRGTPSPGGRVIKSRSRIGVQSTPS